MNIQKLTFVSDSKLGLLYEVEFSRKKTLFKKAFQEKRKVWIEKYNFGETILYSSFAVDYETGKNPYNDISLAIHISKIVTHDFEANNKCK